MKVVCRWYRLQYRIERRRARQAVIEAAKILAFATKPYDDTDITRLRHAAKDLIYLEGQSWGVKEDQP